MPDDATDAPRLRSGLAVLADQVEAPPDGLDRIRVRARRRARRRRLASGAVPAAFLVVVVGGAVVVAHRDGPAPASDHDGQYLVPSSVDGSVSIETEDSEGHYSAVYETPSGEVVVLTVNLHGTFEPSPEFQALLDQAPRAQLANGLDVRLYCGGDVSSTSTHPGPLSASWQTGDTFGTVYLPSTTPSCATPTSADGPLVDAAATLRWVDQADFEHMVRDSPQATPTTAP